MSKSEQPKKSELPKTIRVEINGKDQEILMSFGLLNELSRTVGSLEEVQIVMLDTDRSLELLNLCVALRDENGNIDIANSTDISKGDAIDTDTYEALLNWVLQHVMSFFMKRARALATASKALGPDLMHLSKLAAGLNDLTSSPQ